MVAHRLEADLPLPIAELTWNYRKSPVRLPGEGQRRVIAQAARTTQIARSLQRLEEAGASVDVLTTEAEGLGALYRHGLGRSGGDGVEVLVLATSDDWTVAVLRDGLVESLRHIAADPQRPDTAERLCRQVIEGHLPLRDVRRMLWCASPDCEPARTPLGERLGIPVEPVEPTHGLCGEDGSRIRSEQLAAFGTAIGLALTGLHPSEGIIHLSRRETPIEEPHRKIVRMIVSHPWRWGIVAASLLASAAIVHFGAVAWEMRQMRRLLGDAVRTTSPLDALQPRILAMQRLRTYRIDVEGIVAEVCKQVPDSVVLSTIQLSRDRRFIIKGTAGDPKAVFALADALRKCNRLSSVSPERTEPGQGGGFTLSAELVGVNKLPSQGGRGASWR